MVVLACGWKIHRMWLDDTVFLSTFTYSKDGDSRPEKAKRFIEATDVDMQAIVELYGGMEASEVLPDADGGGAAQPAFVQPIVKRSDIPSVEIEAYGLPVGRLLHEINRFVDANSEIVGSATERDSGVEVYARLRGGKYKAPPWYIPSAPSFEDATYDLACRIYHAMAPQDSLLSGIGNDEFVAFTRALRDYSHYRRLSAESRPQNAETYLKAASDAVAKIVAKNDDFALAHKLRATIAVQDKNYVLAQSSLDRYAALLRQSKRTDRDLTLLLAAAAVPTHIAAAVAAAAPVPVRTVTPTPGTPTSTTVRTKTATPGPTPTKTTSPATTLASKATTTPSTPERLHRVRPLRPGISIGLAGERNSIGTLSFFVKDAQGVVYALSSGLTLDGKPGDAVVQPSLLDGGTPDDAIGEIEYVTPLADELSVSYALIKLRPDIAWQNELPVIGRIAGVRDAVIDVGSNIIAVGRTSGAVEGVIDVIRLSTKVQLRGRTVIFEDVYGARGRKDTDGGVTAAGDSGAPVVDEEGRLVGLVFAGSPGMTLIMPAHAVLRAGNLTLA
ncbi:MAG TPA: hypothetical protein VF432_01745 [Thermoanaerobaculia bacterium]